MARDEQLACLKDRPCDVCKMRTDKGCSSWECVFEQTPDEEKNICNRCQHQIVCKLEDDSVVVKCAEYLEIKRSDFEKIEPSIQPTVKENLVVGDCISRNKVLEGKVIHQSCDGVEIINGYAVPVEYIEKLPSIRPKTKTGHWIRMSDLSEQEDDRYQCSRCKNVVHYKNKMNLYTFNSWCGRCGSDNGRKIEVEL